MTPFLTPLYCLAAFAVGFVAGTIIAFVYVGAKAILRRIRYNFGKPLTKQQNATHYMRIQKLTLDNEDIKKAVQAHLATIGITLPVHSVLHENKWNDHEVVFDFQVKNNLIQDDKSQ
jgi:hypothetical protein